MAVNVTRLPSGLTIVTDEMPLETASLGVWHGVSHFLEHMAFKGTQRRSARQIVEDIENVGGDLNAATSIEMTAYYARVLKADVPLGLDVLSDILSEPLFDAEEVARERSVIEQEIGAAQDTPDDVIFEYVSELAFPGQPIGRSLLGTPEALELITGDSLRAYLDKHYRAPDMVVAATGGVKHDDVVAEVTQRFGKFNGPAAPCPQPAKFGGGTRVVHRDLEQAHLTFGLEGLPQTDPLLFSLQVFSNILGGGMSSRLMQEVREKRGLCYSIYSFHMSYSDTGFFGVYTGTDPDDASEMMEVVVDEIRSAADTLSDVEVA